MHRSNLLLRVFLLAVMCGTSIKAAESDAATRVTEAIDSIRHLKVDGLSDGEKKLVSSRLDKARKALRKNRKVAIPAVRKALAEEHEDSALIIELSAFLLRMDSSDAALREIAGYLVKADPNIHFAGFFDVTFVMASRRCLPCLPAVLKILEGKEEEVDVVTIKALSKRVGIIHGMVFTIGQYGDDVIDDVTPYLESDNCIVRSNAILALSDLVPVEEPAALRKIAIEDPCSEARAAAWAGLGVFHNTGREEMALTRLYTEPRPMPGEMEGLTFVLATVDSDASRKALRDLANDSDPNVARFALGRVAFAHDVALPPDVPADPRWRRDVVGQLERALRTDHLYAKPDVSRFLASLTPEDLPLVNRARASVLRRLSDEALYDEWYPLRSVARRLRERGESAGNASDGK